MQASSRYSAQIVGTALGSPHNDTGPLRIPLRDAPLVFEQGSLAFDPPAVSGQVAVFTHHPVTRNDNGNRIGGAGASDGPRGLGLAQRFRNLAVGARGPIGNAPQRFPHALLKRCGLDVEW